MIGIYSVNPSPACLILAVLTCREYHSATVTLPAAGATAAVHEYRRAHDIQDPIMLAPSDYLYTCSTGPPGSGLAADVTTLGRCTHPRTSLFYYNKHGVTGLLPHVAFWVKSDITTTTAPPHHHPTPHHPRSVPCH